MFDDGAEGALSELFELEVLIVLVPDSDEVIDFGFEVEAE